MFEQGEGQREKKESRLHAERTALQGACSLDLEIMTRAEGRCLID